jgi:hypothetical protein
VRARVADMLGEPVAAPAVSVDHAK